MEDGSRAGVASGGEIGKRDEIRAERRGEGGKGKAGASVKAKGGAGKHLDSRD